MAEKRLTSTARKLRREMTEAERTLWAHLKDRSLFGARITRQFPIGDHIVDFACRRLRLAIEIDGGQHSDSAADAIRTRNIEAHGYRVIRFWNHEVHGNIDGVLTAIAREIEIARNR
jgi:BirA family biotin operon repressor/biotin-[acetyl-CoA-carboxylase] ligase